jgi:hypothetical protein
MSRVLKVSQSNYRLQTAAGGTITLDTGVDVGTVIVTGDLVVQGETTTVNTTNLAIEDNVIVLNKNQTGSGIALTAPISGRSGIQIGRGTSQVLYPDAQFIFDENVNHYDFPNTTNVGGTFVLKTVDGKKAGLQVATIVNDGASNLVFDMQSTSGVLSIANSTNYYLRVTNDNDIPNWRTILNYVAASNGVATVDRMYFPPGASFGSEDSKVQAFNTNIQFYVGQQIRATISPVGVSVNNINLFTDTITNTSANNLVLTAINNNVKIDAVLNLTDQSLSPAVVSGVTKLYSTSTVGPGKSGLFFKNVNTSDELVSKNRAVLLSILL